MLLFLLNLESTGPRGRVSWFQIQASAKQLSLLTSGHLTYKDVEEGDMLLFITSFGGLVAKTAAGEGDRPVRLYNGTLIAAEQ